MDISRITAAIWPWGTTTKEEMECAAKEVSAIGYKSFESVKAAIYAFDMNLDAYKEVLKRYDLNPVSFYFHIPEFNNTDELFANLDNELDFIANLGVERVCLQGTSGRPKVMGEAQKAEELEIITKFAKISKKHGITSNLHPHHNTWVMYEDEIDYILQNSEANVLSFAPDTAHMVAGLCDPVKVIERYADRVNFTHMKDIKNADLKSDGFASAGMEVYSNFCELGQGCVDFKRVFDILKKNQYDGPLCIELDQAPISNAISAKNNFEFMKNNY